jgi:hypothetical protein
MFTPLLLYPRYSLDRRLDGPQKPVWTTWRSENSWPHRASNSDSSATEFLIIGRGGGGSGVGVGGGDGDGREGRDDGAMMIQTEINVTQPRLGMEAKNNRF